MTDEQPKTYPFGDEPTSETVEPSSAQTDEEPVQGTEARTSEANETAEQEQAETDEHVEDAEPAPVASVAPPPHPENVPVHVDNRTRRSDEDALEGHFVKIVNGDHQGRVGSFEQVVEHGKDGYPVKILFRSRDAQSELLTVDYSDVRPAGDYRGGR